MSLTMDWVAFREAFPVFRNFAYLSWASVAALSSPAAEAMRVQACRTRDLGATVYREWYRAYEGVRRSAAELIGASPGEISLLKNTSEGVSTVAFGFPWVPGDNLILPRGEFPANLYPWLALAERGVEVRRAEVGPNGAYQAEQIEALMDGRTRVVAVSFVNYATGFRSPVEALGELCRRRGVLFFVDAIQGLGCLPLDVERLPIDALAADGHKWLCGPEGFGIFYLRAQWRERIAPLSRGWWAVESAGRYEQEDQRLCDSGRRYECGTLTSVAAYGLEAALKLVLEAGVERIAGRVGEMTGELLSRLAAGGYPVVDVPAAPCRSGIVAFGLPGRDPREVAERLEGEGVAVNARAGRLRVSIHAWNDRSDLERLIEGLG